jgi:hypothetical protein
LPASNPKLYEFVPIYMKSVGPGAFERRVVQIVNCPPLLQKPLSITANAFAAQRRLRSLVRSIASTGRVRAQLVWSAIIIAPQPSSKRSFSFNSLTRDHSASIASH